VDDEIAEEFEPEERGEPSSGRVEGHREIEDIPGEDELGPPLDTLPEAGSEATPEPDVPEAADRLEGADSAERPEGRDAEDPGP
jgi:hypothetical protein